MFPVQLLLGLSATFIVDECCVFAAVDCIVYLVLAWGRQGGHVRVKEVGGGEEGTIRFQGGLSASNVHFMSKAAKVTVEKGKAAHHVSAQLEYECTIINIEALEYFNCREFSQEVFFWKVSSQFSFPDIRDWPINDRTVQTSIPESFHSALSVSANADMRKRNSTGGMLSPCWTPTDCGNCTTSRLIFSTMTRSWYVHSISETNWGAP